MKGRLSLLHVSEKLIQATEEYAELCAKFIPLELKYLEKYDKALTSQLGLATQALRDSAVRDQMRLEPEFEEYHSIMAEIRTRETIMRNLSQVSRNLINLNFNPEE